MADKEFWDKFNSAPEKVQMVWLAGMTNQPIGGILWNEVLDNYPEYFPKESARKRKWDAVPKEVHDAYWKEYWEFHDELWRDEPKSGGLVSMLNNDEDYIKWSEAYQRLRPIEEAKEKELHLKYYKKFGV